MRETLNAEVGHGDDIGRSSRTARASVAEVDVNQLWVVVGTDNSDSQGTENEEDAESVVNGLEGVLDGESRALSLGGDH